MTDDPSEMGIDDYARRFRGEGFGINIEIGNLGYNLQKQLGDQCYFARTFEVGGKPAVIAPGPADRKLTMDFRGGIRLLRMRSHACRRSEFAADLRQRQGGAFAGKTRLTRKRLLPPSRKD